MFNKGTKIKHWEGLWQMSFGELNKIKQNNGGGGDADGGDGIDGDAGDGGD